MAAATFKANLKINQGATYTDTWTWTAGPVTPVPVNLTDCVARAQFRPSQDSNTVLLSLTTANGRIILGGTAGTIQILLSAVDTTAMIWEEAVYDLEIEYVDGTVRRLMQGTVIVSPEVTRVP